MLDFKAKMYQIQFRLGIRPRPDLARVSSQKLSLYSVFVLRRRSVIQGRNAATPDPAGGAYSAPPDALAEFKGPTSKGREARGGEGREGEGPPGSCLHPLMRNPG